MPKYMQNFFEKLGQKSDWFINFTKIDNYNCDNSELIINYSDPNHIENSFSLVEYVNINQNELIRNLNKYIVDLKNLNINNLSIENFLKFDDKYSFWNFSPAYERCIVRNPELGDFLKILALEELLIKYKPKTVTINSTNIEVIFIIQAITNNLNIKLNNKKKGKLLIKNIFTNSIFFNRIRAFAKLFEQIFTTLTIEKINNELSDKHDKNALFISYSDNISKTAPHNENSLYWKGIPDLLNDKNIKSNWLHIFTPNSLLSKNDLCFLYKKLQDDTNNFYLLDQMLSFGIIFKTIYLYLKLQSKLIKIEKNIYNLNNIKLKFLWSLLKPAWRRNMYGGSSIAYISQKLLLQKSLDHFKKCNFYIYLFEGMIWEKMLISSIKNPSNNFIYAYQHATLKSLDFRPLSYLEENINKQFLLPDKILVNGKNSKDRLINYGFSRSLLKDVEATRYDHLTYKKYKSIKKIEKSILFILEGIKDTNDFILKLINNYMANFKISKKYEIYVRPHPSLNVIDKIKNKNITIDNNNDISKSIRMFDIICVSINSSAFIDAIHDKKNVIPLWNPKEMIRSTLQNYDLKKFVKNSNQLNKCIVDKVYFEFETKSELKNIFNLSRYRTKWKEIFEKSKK